MKKIFILLLFPFFAHAQTIKVSTHCRDTLIGIDSILLEATVSAAPSNVLWSQSVGTDVVDNNRVLSTMSRNLVPGRHIFTITATVGGVNCSARDTVDVLAKPCPACPVCPTCPPPVVCPICPPPPKPRTPIAYKVDLITLKTTFYYDDGSTSTN